MKTPITLFVLLLIGLALGSCTKEDLNVELPERKDYGNLNSNCSESNCISAIADTKVMYQALANETCEIIWVDITCCSNGRETYALVYIVPSPLVCDSKATILNLQE